jgi:hypothetical protein
MFAPLLRLRVPDTDVLEYLNARFTFSERCRLWHIYEDDRLSFRRGQDVIKWARSLSNET